MVQRMRAADIPDQSQSPSPRTTFCPPDSRRFVLFTAILASSMGFIDGSVVSLAMPAIRADLGASLVDAASNRAFQAIAAIASAMCALAALIAWFTQPSWRREPGVAGAAAVTEA
jgi:hypothetical protein